ncbi:hypothetical protein CCAX7_55570 [Capsulimonas corticalis]|uniref:Uncharacterized protein n=1 Tax=Capsulimonas corticalis TaxID=2219043 RepID=A0A402D0X7_9BACT|nr:ankyrin repeat domain-containing protein [Capsulimonas corticalis]BDI33506.1 hypothetical protein CCAX7_55570 [Capsulimonas corticalis]
MKRRRELDKVIETGDAVRLSALLQAGGDNEEHNHLGWTPLMSTAYKGNLNAMRALISAGADRYTLTRDGECALHIAARGGQADAIRYLISLGLNVNATDHYGEVTPLHIAAAGSRHDIASEACAALLDAGAKIDARNKDGATPLYFASLSMREKVSRFLVSRGADTNVRASKGRTALITVTKLAMKPETASLLVEIGAELDIQDDDGCTALIYAARHTTIGFLDILINAGANPLLQNNEGKTALDIAEEIARTSSSGHSETIAILRRAMI